jgi:hypothetical protein
MCVVSAEGTIGGGTELRCLSGNEVRREGRATGSGRGGQVVTAMGMGMATAMATGREVMVGTKGGIDGRA